MTARTLEEIGQSLDRHLKRGAEAWIAAGKDLVEAKGKLPHGKWIPWLREHGLPSRREAARLMRMAAVFQNGRPCAHFIPHKRTIELLASRAAAPVREQILARVEKGEPITRAKVEAAMDKARGARPRPEPLQPFETMSAGLWKALAAADDWIKKFEAFNENSEKFGADDIARWSKKALEIANTWQEISVQLSQPTRGRCSQDLPHPQRGLASGRMSSRSRKIVRPAASAHQLLPR